jgi:ADP-heptose:LPS heptosyltransferase
MERPPPSPEGISRERRGGHVVVLRALGLGDLLTAVPALRAIRRGFPTATISLACPAVLEPLVVLMGAVDEVLDTPDLGMLGRPKPRPQVAIDLHGWGPESIGDVIGTGAPKVWSHWHPSFPELDGPQWRADQHEVIRWCRMLDYFGLGADPTDLRIAKPEVRSVAPGAVVVHPGAKASGRRWPVDRFATVARALRRSGHRVVVTGSAAELGLASELAQLAGLPDDSVLAGQLDLAALAALVAAARLVVCGDTGVAHLASAYGTPSVLLFGPTPPGWWGPPRGGPHVVLWKGRRGDPHAEQPDPGLLEICPSEVLSAATRLLSQVPPAGGQPTAQTS